MRGITKPCRHTLDASLKQQWMSHLCGLCLTLRDEAGQASRMLTGYDLLLLSVLVEAQAGQQETDTAAQCPLRGMRTAAVVPATNAGARLAAAGSLLAGSAAIEDKVRDHDIPRVADPVASRWAGRTLTVGRRLAGESGLDGDLLARGGRRAAQAETSGGSLSDLLAASGEVVAELFAHTAAVAGKPANSEPLRRAGDAFGRLVHLLDAVDDYPSDVRHGRFNPLAATSTSPDAARRLALDLAASIREAIGAADLVDPRLALTLLGPVLERSVKRAFTRTAGGEKETGAAGHECSSAGHVALRGADPDAGSAHCSSGRGLAARTRRVAASAGATLAAVAAGPALLFGIFGRPGRRRPPYYGDPYGPPPGYGGYGGYGYRRRGPSCCDMLACDCCANMACSDCCGGDDCCVCCC